MALSVSTSSYANPNPYHINLLSQTSEGKTSKKPFLIPHLSFGFKIQDSGFKGEFGSKVLGRAKRQSRLHGYD